MTSLVPLHGDTPLLLPSETSSFIPILRRAGVNLSIHVCTMGCCLLGHRWLELKCVQWTPAGPISFSSLGIWNGGTIWLHQYLQMVGPVTQNFQNCRAAVCVSFGMWKADVWDGKNEIDIQRDIDTHFGSVSPLEIHPPQHTPKSRSKLAWSSLHSLQLKSPNPYMRAQRPFSRVTEDSVAF